MWQIEQRDERRGSSIAVWGRVRARLAVEERSLGGARELNGYRIRT